ncbi:MAG: methyltransferase small [Nocardioides sp.]|nr:methyltransferase small [Nocardioides sp.]
MKAGTVEPFGSLRVAYDDRVLQPRAWTVAQSLWAAELLKAAPPGPLLELCAGAGQIGLLAIATEPRPLVAVDANPVACEYARRNADSAGLGDLVEVRAGRIDEVLDPGESFALVIADPPWVRRSDIGRHPSDPRYAIDGGYDGLDVARSCVEAASVHLTPGGSTLLQLGTVEQAEIIRAELALYGDLGFVEIRFFDGGVVVRLDRQVR